MACVVVMAVKATLIAAGGVLRGGCVASECQENILNHLDLYSTCIIFVCEQP